MVTGLIYAAIVVLWAAYLVPLALRRYDEASRERSVETFSPRMRMLHRGRAEEATAEEDSDSTPEPPPSTSAETPAPVQRESTRIAVRRRRRTLLTLLFATSVVGGLCAGALLPWWSLAIPVALVVAWLVACRIQVLGEQAAPVHEGLGDEPDDEPTIVLSGQLEDYLPEHKHVMLQEPLDDADLEERVNVAVPFSTSDGQSLWDPVPVTLPTYVDKPVAARTVRTIDFNSPDAWTSGHVEGEDTELPDRHADEDAARRRAVGD